MHFYSEGLADGCHLFLVLRTFLSLSLAVPDFGDELVKPDHLNSYLNISRSKLFNGGGVLSVRVPVCPRGYRGVCVESSRTRNSPCDSWSDSLAMWLALIL